jgi:membrane-bound lytic murein transglycosylase MltF
MTTRDELSRIAYTVAANAVRAVRIDDLNQATGEKLVSPDQWFALTNEEQAVVGDYLEEIRAALAREAEALEQRGGA